MPRILDIIERGLLPAGRQTLVFSERAGFDVGCFNLRGRMQLARYPERWAGGEGHCCWLLVGIQRLPDVDFWEALLR